MNFLFGVVVGLLIVCLYRIYRTCGHKMAGAAMEQMPVMEPAVAPAPSRSFMEDKDLMVGADYSNYVLNTGLDQSVIESHRRFTDDLQNSTARTSSMQTELSSDVYDNPWVGLRRPNTDVKVSKEARQVPTADQFQQERSSTTKLYSILNPDWYRA